MINKLVTNDLPRPAPRSSEPEVLASEIIERLTYRIGKDVKVAKPHDWLTATILVIRDRVIDKWMESTRKAYQNDSKRVYYLSLEFLIGRLMRDAISNLGLMGEIKDALTSLGVEFDVIAGLEPDAALGNGGLGRLAACFMESMATVDIPAYGYGIRYVHGLFRQQMAEGWQVELPETWLAHGNPWEFERRESSYEIGFGGSVETVGGYEDPERFVWKPAERMIATAFDTPVVGWRGTRVNTLRLWSAQPIDPILLDAFNAGDHIGALRESNKAEALTRVLYPADANPAGQELRLRQEYFFSSASLQDILRRHLQQYPDFTNLADKVSIQLNDTHPAISIAEMMRLLGDVHGLTFEESWHITRHTFSYTNHTLLPEALESWPVPLLERLLPRHMQIIYAINAQTLLFARKEKKMLDQQVRSISLIEEGGERRVRMGNLAFIGSHSINGVSALHTELMKETVFSDLHTLYPDRINNKTNGITPRRWLMQCNPGLTDLIRESIGDEFLDDAEKLVALDRFAEDAGFREKFAEIKRQNKVRLANLVAQRMGIRVDPSAMFDIQIKRIHEYKRQLLNLVEAVALYDQIRSRPELDWVPRVKFFAGKAAPSYHNAKLIIKLANDIARVINNDPAVRGLLKVVFIPNYNVSLAEIMVPAADLSEQISTAGMEASGTGNMKFGLNGALTIGTLDGANVEMLEHVGADNIVIFGKTAAEVAQARAEGHNPRAIIENSAELSQAVSSIASGVFSPDDRSRFAELMDGIYNTDWFMVAADFDAYAQAQRDVDAIWSEPASWYEKTVRNTARMGWFSSDRTIRQYASEIWRA
ncbi:glycogen/starch/alpha-glucan phosphorylase [Agrobacterium rosae]|uniref:Alpha-1,4 glucan phosphorylase n=1 Tax=Agrobacterium rosae TaxID=1972867 RepID=A0AAE5S0L3_9HYPH|nr:glycogen/starch/alpha-glucan phosphorylase [Agrobacterium rosae]KAA3513032.1 glycogen/starch/alpha-glucan phosphorylase [Agrobacterium rosae]KAA3521480.1 glycogen/starch/alpha-glucan phosphorylase [Agrobacterium rosae]MCM2432651.1 glycogen/starch/alpha-glucan phosphorylase [Agrobacterium rosae]MDX8301921.1 glycogen/starch/alpha-glucan phosphorylase [Agrobacterium rosae]MDX8328278.1 glycogen/starch/alpha-glucan phosphorylase [Agrobacterium rosae]